ncbi:MAG: MoxR family ATPase [Planctomycetota bacterium]
MPDLADLPVFAAARTRLLSAVATRVVGQDATVEAVLTAVFAGGHVLLVGAPGLAKTLLVHTLADALGWSFHRIQFTPDLMPSDITGTEILREDRATGARELAFVPGPVFANLVLADEINRAPPKTQAALLESMQERSVTCSGATRALPQPFFVLATQNPIEQEGTYPLPEAQLDRFLVGIRVPYPTRDEELAVAALDTRRRAPVAPVLSIEEFQRCADLVAAIPVPPVAVAHAVDLCRASRPDAQASPWVREHVAWGAGPRAAQALVACARARAALQGRAAAEPADIRAVAPLVLPHRLVPSFAAAGAGIDGVAIVKRLLETVKP